MFEIRKTTTNHITAMKNQLLNQKLQSNRAQIDEVIKDLHELTIKINHEELSHTVSDLRNRIHEPFMFVIVGEVKSGKSSFINALLDTKKEITKVAPQPMTDTIQQILYGEEEKIITLNPHLKKILQPIDILKEIAIVDTPGTNTIIEHHQEITEKFVPASDLIVFVFEAKNPYRQSAWEFFDYIHSDWRKKIIFVLQQKDLMPEEDLLVNKKGLEDYARKKGIDEPLVFAVSAKDELEGKQNTSGFAELRAYISKNITGGQAPILKMQNNIATSRNINDRIHSGLQVRHRQLEADVDFRRDITETLDHQEKKSTKQVDILVENLVAGYDRTTRKYTEELSSGLSFFALLRRSFSSIFSKKASAKEWLENLAKNMERDLHQELSAKLNDGVSDLADSIQQMAKLIDLKIRDSKTILRNDHGIFSDIAERRSNIMQELQTAFAKFLQEAENFSDEELFPDKSALSPNLATGSGLAVIGIILMAVTNGIVFDITGGVLTTIGLLFAGFSTSGKRRKIIKEFKHEIDKGREKLEQEVSENLKGYIKNLKDRIDSNFHDFDNLLVKEEKQIDKLNAEQEKIESQLVEMEQELSELL